MKGREVKEELEVWRKFETGWDGIKVNELGGLMGSVEGLFEVVEDDSMVIFICFILWFFFVVFGFWRIGIEKVGN